MPQKKWPPRITLELSRTPQTLQDHRDKMSDLLIKFLQRDKSLVDLEDALEPIKKSLLFAYNVRRKNKNKDIPYNGYEVPESVAHVSLPYDAYLNTEGQKYNENQGRDMLDVFLMMAFQIGLENGQRMGYRDGFQDAMVNEMNVIRPE